MSLVAYDSSDESEHESENETNDRAAGAPTLDADMPSKCPVVKSDIVATPDDLETSVTGSAKKGLFNLLPPPKSTTLSEIIPEEPVLNIPPKKEPVKIMIPSLKEFEDDAEEEKLKAKRKPSMTGSGLIGLLPQPQKLPIKETAKQLVPLSVSRKSVLQATTSEPSIKVPPKTPNASKVREGNDSDEETPVTDFFSLSESKELEIPVPEIQPEPNPKEDLMKKPENCDIANYGGDEHLGDVGNSHDTMGQIYYPDTNFPTAHYEVPTNANYDNVYNHNYDVSNAQGFDYTVPTQEADSSAMKNEAIARLAGKKRGQESIEFVDVNGDDLVAGREEWLLKSLSETNSYQPAPKRSDQPSAMHRRKHQITYLAFQAKAREQELKNQWSMNRMTKKQTQSKYGF